MARREDHETSTVDGAAAFERHHGQEPDDDRPTLADLWTPDDVGEPEDEPGGHRPGCYALDPSECFC